MHKTFVHKEFVIRVFHLEILRGWNGTKNEYTREGFATKTKQPPIKIWGKGQIKNSIGGRSVKVSITTTPPTQGYQMESTIVGGGVCSTLLQTKFLYSF